ncbi:hypothetical protein THAOC_05864 [Thalassiosira oceanica]|uniref:Uncharacterized protein n=1 Tax=Thalassiosira oceanica TaxID=159749 RepID=K0T668_THAOC|nr:hypothetical protein THAOC_05864 [Thalassiosira oceanica]|mmetsp:Transcript_30912/g.73675  ORF Transcript_30912/g.73675 Transcript_30912/m.73675 type:complete len:161 (-) Transcript_30912:247-729(-)|eukprot:EJK72594.1 hypothetical protein THAOC_05864 [Thalassiosira oceanica]
MVPRAVIVIATILAMCLSQVESFTGAQRRIQKGAASAAESKTSLYAVKKAKKASKKKSSKAKEEVVNFKKAEFISAVAEKTGMTKADSELALSAVLSVIATEVADGKRISLPGFGTFKLNFRAARKGRNPKTGEEIDIRASNSPSFSASKTFKDLCNPDR